MSFGRYIKDVQNKLNLSREELSILLDITVPAVRYILTDQTKFPSDKLIDRMSLVFNCSRYEVVRDIMFYDIKPDDPNYKTTKYLAYAVLHGWKMIDIPYLSKNNAGEEVKFDARAAVTRQPRNIALFNMASNCLNERLLKLMTELSNKEFTSVILSCPMDLIEDFRRYYIVFDINDENEMRMYDKLTCGPFRRCGFNYNFLLFDFENYKSISCLRRSQI